MIALWRWLMAAKKKLIKPEGGEPTKSLTLEIPTWQYPQLVAAAKREGKAVSFFVLDAVTEAALKSQAQAEASVAKQARSEASGAPAVTEAAPSADPTPTPVMVPEPSRQTAAAQAAKRQFDARGNRVPPAEEVIAPPTAAAQVVEALAPTGVDPRTAAHPCRYFSAVIPANYRGGEVAGSCSKKGGGPCHYNIGLARNCNIFYAKPAARR